MLRFSGEIIKLATLCCADCNYLPLCFCEKIAIFSVLMREIAIWISNNFENCSAFFHMKLLFEMCNVSYPIFTPEIQKFSDSWHTFRQHTFCNHYFNRFAANFCTSQTVYYWSLFVIIMWLLQKLGLGNACRRLSHWIVLSA